MTFSPNAESPVLLISAGTIGLATGWELARKGVPVEVSERDGARRGATWKAGGMLTPVTAQKIANLVRAGTVSVWLEPFLPSRFADKIPAS